MPQSSLKKPLRALEPLLGTWRHAGDSDLGALACTRTFAPILDGHGVRLEAVWTYDDPKRGDYLELCVFGPGRDGGIGFESFINDGSRSHGVLTEAADLDAGAISFEAQMPHGLARQTYSPDGEGGWRWRVERKVKAGWSLLAEHVYQPVDPVG